MHTHTLPQGPLRRQSCCPSPSGTVWFWARRLSCFPPSTGPVSGLWCGLEQGPGFPGKWRPRVTVIHPMLFCVQVTVCRRCCRLVPGSVARGGVGSSAAPPFLWSQTYLPPGGWVAWGLGRVGAESENFSRPSSVHPINVKELGSQPLPTVLSPPPLLPQSPVILCHVG